MNCDLLHSFISRTQTCYKIILKLTDLPNCLKPGSFFMIWPWYTHVSSLGGYMVFNFINTQVMKTSQALWLPHISDNSSWHFNKILLWLCSWNVGFSAKESIPVFHRWYNTDKLWLHKSFQFENPCRNLLPCIFEFFF